MNHFGPTDWPTFLTALAAAIVSVINAWKGKKTETKVGAIFHETVIRPQIERTMARAAAEQKGKQS